MEGREFEILNRAGELFKLSGFKQVTMDDIAKDMGMSKKTLYKYFDNKKALIKKIIGLYIKEEKSHLHGFSESAESAIGEMVKIIKHVIQMFDDVDMDIYIELKKYYPESWNKLDSYLNVHIYTRILNNIRRGMEEELYRSDLDPDIIAKMYVVKVNGIMEEKTFPGKIYDKKILMRALIEYHLRGIVNVKGLEKFEDYKRKGI
jgi:AcrR family transcriptional regulator